jgi:PAS domain S-box-containing protein
MRIFCLQLVLLICFGIEAFPQITQKNKVLVVFSYEETFPSYEHVNRALLESADGLSIDFDYFYLDSKYRSDKEYLAIATNFLHAKISKREKYSAIITVDDNALHLVENNHNRFFKDIPVVFLGVNNVEYALSMNQNKDMTGVVEAVSMKETLKLMTTVQPLLESVYVVSDETETSISDLKLFLNEISDFPAIKYYVLNVGEFSFEDFYSKIAQINERNAAFLLLAAYKDKNDSYMTFNQLLKKMVSASNLPIYHIYLHGVGSGLTGGYVVSHYEQTRRALQMLEKIFAGNSTANIKVIEKSPNIPVVDVSQLTRHNIPLDNIPKGTLTVNQPGKTMLINRQVYKILITTISSLILLVLLSLFLARKLSRKNKKLKEDNELYRKLFIDSPIPMMIIDPETLNITDVNHSVSRIYGYTEQEFSAMQITDINKLPKESVKELTNKILSESSVVLNLKHYKKDGQVMFVEVFSSSLYIRDKQMIYNVIFDQTEQKQMENDIRLALEQARENELLKASFLRTMNHEVRTPLNGVLGFTELLLAKTNPDETTARYGLYIRSCSEKLMDIIDSILDLSMLENKQAKVNLTRFNIAELVDEIYEKNLRQFEGKEVKFTFSINSSTGDEMFSDKRKILKTINHLLSNAAKFTHKGSVNLKVQCTDNKVRFSVEDTGIGIDPKYHQTIFDRFRQLELTNTRQYGGAGVGLAIVKEYVTLLKGKISVQSNLGDGSVFTIEMPRVLELEATAVQQAAINISYN